MCPGGSKDKKKDKKKDEPPLFNSFNTDDKKDSEIRKKTPKK